MPNRERSAWVLIWLSFFTFCVLVVAIPVGARAYILNAEERHEAVVESLSGTVVVEPAIGAGSVPLGKGQSRTISEGTVIRTDETSEAVVTFFDFSNVRVSSGSTLRVDRCRSARYRWGTSPNTIHVTLLGGHAYVGTSIVLDADLDFRVMTLQGELILAPDGSYSLESTNERLDITANRGQIIASAGGRSVIVKAGQRTQVVLGQSPDQPTDAARDLVVNGDFQSPLGQGWNVYNDQGTDGGSVDGSAEIVVEEGRRALRLVRVGGDGNHCETVLEQRLDLNVAEFNSLVLQANVKVVNQSLSGGGYLASEFPLMVRITYRDVYDSEAEWIQGFYYQNVDGNPTTYGQAIPRDRWYPFESPNLLQSLNVRPYKIVSVRIYASGWDYESLVSDVHLIAE